jgi:DNA-binding protein HU-beta
MSTYGCGFRIRGGVVSTIESGLAVFFVECAGISETSQSPPLFCSEDMLSYKRETHTLLDSIRSTDDRTLFLEASPALCEYLVLQVKIRGGHSMTDNSLNKTELVAKVAADSGQSRVAVDGILNTFFATLAEAMKNDSKVTIPGWLGVERTATAARTGRNLQTGEEISNAAGHRVKLTAGSKLKAAAK